MSQLNSELHGNLRMADQVRQGYSQAEAGLAKAMKNGRARKHLQPGMLEQMRNQKADAVKGAHEADEAGNRGQDQFTQGPQSTLLNGVDPLSRNLACQMNQTIGMDLAANSLRPAPNIDSVNDPQQLMSLLRDSQVRQQRLAQVRSTLGRQQGSQIQQNRNFSQEMKKYGELEKNFGLRERSYAMKDRMFQGISKTMQSAAKAMNAAAVGLDAAAGAVQAAAAAVAAIPFVGGAIAIALKVVAKGLKVAAKGMRVVGKKMATTGTKMSAKAKQMAGMSKKMQSSKLANQAKKVASKTKLTQGSQKLKALQSRISQINKDLQTQRTSMGKISQRMKQLGLSYPGSTRAGVGPGLPMTRTPLLPSLGLGNLAGPRGGNFSLAGAALNVFGGALNSGVGGAILGGLSSVSLDSMPSVPQGFPTHSGANSICSGAESRSAGAIYV
jgi:hypothetical protein